MPCSGVVSTGHCCSVFCVLHRSWSSIPVAQGFVKFSDAMHRALSTFQGQGQPHTGRAAAAAWLEPRAGVFCSDHEGHPDSHSLDIPQGLLCHQLPGKAGTAAAWPGWQLECD